MLLILSVCVCVCVALVFAPVEFTPLYYGIAGRHLISGSGSGQGESRQTDAAAIVVGGALIEPHGFVNSACLRQTVHASGQSCTLRIPVPHTVISVFEQTGISSCAVAQGLSLSGKVSVGEFERLDLPVHHYYDPVAGRTAKLLYVDGGGSDNSGILPLLRRRVCKIISSYAMNVCVSLPGQENGATSSMANIAGLFGCMSSGGGGGGGDDKSAAASMIRDKDKAFNDMRHVFPCEHFQVLLDGLRANVAAGRPASYLLRTRALPNSFAGVPGGHDVLLLFICNAECSNWLDSLPVETRRKLDEDKETNIVEQAAMFLGVMKEDFCGFPFTSLKHWNYSVPLTSAYTQLMTWEVMESKHYIDELMSCAM